MPDGSAKAPIPPGPRPVVGVTAKHGALEWIQEHTSHYRNVLAALDVIPVVLAPDAPAVLPDGRRFQPDARGRLPEAVLDALDGLVLSGGGDVHPRYFGEPLAGADPEAIDEARDELEIHLARAALARGMPVFGICRGCQVLNVAAGGGMVQDLPGHRSSTLRPVLHRVRVEPGSWLAEILEVEALDVNTYHHQGVDDATLAPGWVPQARATADPWLLEAFASSTHPWALGVQWHPERLFELPPEHRRLWRSFVDAVNVRARARPVPRPS